MAAYLNKNGVKPLEGLVITRYGHLDPTFRPRQIRVIEASHPVPDVEGQQAAQECSAVGRLRFELE